MIIDSPNAEKGTDLYSQSGVDTAQSDVLMKWISSSSQVSDPSSSIGDFAACYPADFGEYKHPMLVSSTDGVGTKLLLAIEQKQLHGLGYDLVGMCVNDLYTVGAKPLFFLDYYACAHLNAQDFKTVLSGIRSALLSCSTSLVGGETAEMPGLYHSNHFDLAGFVVGVVDRDHRLGSHKVSSGSCLVAIPSSGFHSNGYSLLRRWVEKYHFSDQEIEYLLKPTEIYHSLQHIYSQMNFRGIEGMAHITGGGICQNLARIIPRHLQAQINFDDIRTPAMMQNIFDRCEVSSSDLVDVFNLGIGMICVVNESSLKSFLSLCDLSELGAYQIGRVVDVEKESSKRVHITYCDR